MDIIRSRRGTGLVDVMVTLFLLGVAGIVFSAVFPTGFKAVKQGREYKVAATIAQRKMEQLRAMNYESLTYTLLLSAGVIDSSSPSSPYSFTSTDALSTELPSGTGSLYISDVASDLKRVRLVVSWQGINENQPRTVEINTLFADKRTRKMN
ncbi:MAG: hypothetical protein M1133_03950 [Armatimonadetes bacterium]|nr:hypothetical protein [Armatimonadota bacterium]